MTVVMFTQEIIGAIVNISEQLTIANELKRKELKLKEEELKIKREGV